VRPGPADRRAWSMHCRRSCRTLGCAAGGQRRVAVAPVRRCCMLPAGRHADRLNCAEPGSGPCRCRRIVRISEPAGARRHSQTRGGRGCCGRESRDLEAHRPAGITDAQCGGKPPCEDSPDGQADRLPAPPRWTGAAVVLACGTATHRIGRYRRPRPLLPMDLWRARRCCCEPVDRAGTGQPDALCGGACDASWLRCLAAGLRRAREHCCPTRTRR